MKLTCFLSLTLTLTLSLSLSFFLSLSHTHTHTHTLTGGKAKSVSRIILDIAKKEGPHHLFKGLTPRLIAVPSMMSVFYVINEELEKILLGKEFPN